MKNTVVGIGVKKMSPAFINLKARKSVAFITICTTWPCSSWATCQPWPLNYEQQCFLIHICTSALCTVADW